jgi:hypothetical protein
LFLPFGFRNRAAAARRSNLTDAPSEAPLKRAAVRSDRQLSKKGSPRMAATACLIALAIGGLILIAFSELLP